MKSTRVNRESGFTLIEIVMVLVLLGILAAVAVPKYFDLQALAQKRAAQAAVAEAQARINATFAKELLNGETCTKARTAATTDLFKDNVVDNKGDGTTLDLGDWKVISAGWTQTGDNTKNIEEISVTVKYKGQNAADTTGGDVVLTSKLYAPMCN